MSKVYSLKKSHNCPYGQLCDFLWEGYVLDRKKKKNDKIRNGIVLLSTTNAGRAGEERKMKVLFKRIPCAFVYLFMAMMASLLLWSIFHIPNGAEGVRICHNGSEHPEELFLYPGYGNVVRIQVKSDGCTKGAADLLPSDDKVKLITFNPTYDIGGDYYIQLGKLKDGIVVWGKKVKVGRGSDGIFRVLLEGKDFPSEALLRLRVSDITGG